MFEAKIHDVCQNCNILVISSLVKKKEKFKGNLMTNFKENRKESRCLNEKELNLFHLVFVRCLSY